MILRQRFGWACLSLGLAFTPACSGDDDDDTAGGGTPEPKPGALIEVTAKSRVGVLLDEVPESSRDRVAEALLAKPEAFYIERAKRQLALASYRLNFRPFFYDDDSGKRQLPLPPEKVLDLRLLEGKGGDKVRRETVEGHDYVLADYSLHAVVVTDAESPGKSEPDLAEVGGVTEEPFTFPIDPELLLQRTGYACMDEDEFPPNSVDGENVATFYDQDCEAAVTEDETENSDCHITQQPDESCLDALDRAVGKVETNLHFERLGWDDALAEQSRVGAVTNATGADLAVIGAGLENNRIIYRYIDANSCAVQEGCVSGTGWRRLLQFDASVRNQGAQALNIGDVDYFVSMTPTTLGDHNIYVYSECHHHYHFSHYGDFVLRTPDSYIGNKQAFCLQSTARYSNNESSPLTNPYSGCDYQGIEAGWGDDYGAGIECQWIDVTGMADAAPINAKLDFKSNPDQFLCEGGEPILDANGDPTWVPTTLTPATGHPVDKPACTFAPGWDQDNTDAYPVTLPLDGNGYVTAPCTRGQLGPLRNCGLVKQDDTLHCTPGATVTLSCTVPAAAAPHAVRVCETSAVLKTGIPCIQAEALAVGTVDTGTAATVSFTCPGARDANEPGGGYALYTGPIFPDDPAQTVSCTAM